MITINLREYYPFYTEDTYIEVSNEIADQLYQFALDDAAYRIRILRAKAYFSIDNGEYIEHDATYKPATPEEVFDSSETGRILKDAMLSLTPTQSRRIYTNVILGRSKTEIAKAEGVDESSVRESISKGLEKSE